MADSALEHRARILLDSLSRQPRFAGSRGEDEARKICRLALEGAGFQCRELPFEYSQWPGRWGPPLVAAVQAATIVAVSRTANTVGPLPAVLLAGVAAVALFSLIGRAKRGWVRDLSVQRATATNLEAVRGHPRVWLCAHLDSKSQTIPMLLRIASAVALGAVTIIGALTLLVTVVTDAPVRALWAAVEIAAVVAALPSVFCWVGDKSSGALDNATGVAAILLAAEASEASQLGVLVTSGEELGLAGARAWASSTDRGISVINCDTLDDRGRFRCMYTGAKPDGLLRASKASAERLGLDLTTGRLIPGILADSVAFADLGIQAVTISRGTLSTLARIHTRRDYSNAMTGRGVADGARLLTALTRELA